MNHRHDDHPNWCGRGHLCSHDQPAGEHRSYPVTLDTTTARIVVTRIRTHTGAQRLELRVVVDLPSNPQRAHAVARHAVVRVCQAVHRASTTGVAR